MHRRLLHKFKDTSSSSDTDRKGATQLNLSSAAEHSLPATRSSATGLESNVGPREIWKEAFDSLPQEERNILHSSESEGTRSNLPFQVENVIELTQSKYKEYCECGWHTRKGNKTRETSVKILAKETLCSALVFKDIIDQGLKFDPSGYGTIAWGVVSGVLTLLQNDQERADAVFNSAAVMTKFLPKYAIIEAHYRDRPTQEQKAFEDRILGVYIAILKYAVEVKKELNISLATRALDSFWTLEKQAVKILQDEVEAKDQVATNFSQFVAHQYRKKEFEELNKQAKETLDQIAVTAEKLFKIEKANTLKWLSDNSPPDKQQLLRTQIDRVNSNSGQWLLDSQDFSEWLGNPHSFLWLYGASGCGKSSLCSTVVKDLLKSSEQDDNIIVAYWYFDNADPITQNLQSLIRFILRRVAAYADPFPKAILDLAKRFELSNADPSIVELNQVLQDTISAAKEDIFVVLDAIDEYRAGNFPLREEFLGTLCKLNQAQLQKLHVLVTGISESDIQAAFSRLNQPPAEINIEKSVSVDLDAYLDITIEKYATTKKWSTEIKSKVEKTLKADGRFRITALQLEDLRQCYDEKEVEDALNSIPGTIEEMYLRKLKIVALKNRGRLSHIFYWISLSKRQLTLNELAAAPGVVLLNPDDVFELCPSGLLRLEEKTKIVTFDHPSVKRYLHSHSLREIDEKSASPYYIDDEAVNAQLADMLINYILGVDQSLDSIEQTTKTAPFFVYAAECWYKHMKRSETAMYIDSPFGTKIVELFRDPINPPFLNWMRVANPESVHSDFKLSETNCPSPLYVALSLQLWDVAQLLVDNKSYINAPGGSHGTALQLAAKAVGKGNLVRQLIGKGADVNATSNDQVSALYDAAMDGDHDLVQTLLAAGAKIEVPGTQFGTVLHMACYIGEKHVVEKILTHGTDVNAEGGQFGTALQAASAAGHTDIVAMLLNQANGAKVDPDARSGMLGSPLLAAISGGHSEIVAMLKASGATFDDKSDRVWKQAFISFEPLKAKATEYLGFSKTKLEIGHLDESQLLLGSILLFLDPARPEVQKLLSGHWVHSKKRTARLNGLRSITAKIVERALENGLAGKDSENYLYRASFWALVIKLMLLLSQDTDILGESLSLMQQFVDCIELKFADQQTIEHNESKSFQIAEQELVRLYTRAFVILIQELDSMGLGKLWRRMKLDMEREERFKLFNEHDEKFKSVIAVARLEALPGNIENQILNNLRGSIRQESRERDDRFAAELSALESRILKTIRTELPELIRKEVQRQIQGYQISPTLRDTPGH